MIWQMDLNSSSMLCDQTSRIPHSSFEAPGPGITPEAAADMVGAWPFDTPICMAAGLILLSDKVEDCEAPPGESETLSKGHTNAEVKAAEL